MMLYVRYLPIYRRVLIVDERRSGYSYWYSAKNRLELARHARRQCCRRTGFDDEYRWAVASAVLRYLDLPGDRWRWQPREPHKTPRRDATAGQDAPPDSK